MGKGVDFAALVRGFFENNLVAQRGLSPHTIIAYRDTVKLLMLFGSRRHKKPCVELQLRDFSASTVTGFLDHLERVRKNSTRSRNARLAAIRSFFRYVATVDPRHLAQCRSVLAVPFKRYPHGTFDYLEKDEVSSVFHHISHDEPHAKRDNALLRMLYNTGMRAQELVSLDISHVRFARPYYVRIMGKGHKERTCPIWPETVRALKDYLRERNDVAERDRPLFVNARRNRLSRFGLRHIIAVRIGKAAQSHSALATRRITPHTFRHTTAMHLLQSGVDLNMIRSWLGHSSIDTTHTYVEIDLDMKRKTLQSCEKLLPKGPTGSASWRRQPGILEWLSTL